MSKKASELDYEGVDLQASVIGIILSYSNVEAVADTAYSLAPEVFTNLIYRNAFKQIISCFESGNVPELSAYQI